MPPKDSSPPPLIETGTCECGCGQATTISVRTDRAHGWFAGQPRRFIAGHNRRRCVEDYRADPDTGCWIWLRAYNNKGYGATGRGAKPNRMRGAHIHFWEQVHGPVPEGLELDHLCRNRGCVNPDHLEAVTSAVNARRRPTTKLTEDQVTIIRSLGPTTSRAELGRRFGVHPSGISHILAGDYWREEH